MYMCVFKYRCVYISLACEKDSFVGVNEKSRIAVRANPQPGLASQPALWFARLAFPVPGDGDRIDREAVLRS